MIDSDRSDFIDSLKAVYALYRVEFSAPVAAIWWRALKSYDLAAIDDAFGRHAVNPDTGQFAPKPADVVKMIEGNTVDASMVAWSKVDAAVRLVGTYQTVVFDDALIHRVISDMGGWPNFGNKTEITFDGSTPEWPFVAREFQTRYRGYRGTRSTPEYPAKLIGRFDLENLPQGHAPQLPMLIGDAHHAQRVHDQGTDKPRIAYQSMGVEPRSIVTMISDFVEKKIEGKDERAGKH